MTANSIKCRNVKRGICLADALGIPLLSIYLEDADVGDEEINNILRDNPSILKYGLSDEEYDKLCNEELEDINLKIQDEKKVNIIELMKDLLPFKMNILQMGQAAKDKNESVNSQPSVNVEEHEAKDQSNENGRTITKLKTSIKESLTGRQPNAMQQKGSKNEDLADNNTFSTNQTEVHKNANSEVSEDLHVLPNSASDEEYDKSNIPETSSQDNSSKIHYLWNGSKNVFEFIFDGEREPASMVKTSSEKASMKQQTKTTKENKPIDSVYMCFAYEDIDRVFDDFKIFEDLKIDFKYYEGIDFDDEDKFDCEYIEIAKPNIDKQSAFVFYVSEKSVTYKRTILELEHAIQENIQVCFVVLEKMPQPLVEVLEDNSILKYKINKEEYIDELRNMIKYKKGLMHRKD